MLAAAVTNDERAEAYYYIGMHAVLDGQEDAAVDALAKCVALNRTAFLETKFARSRLKQLEDGQASAEQHSPQQPATAGPLPRRRSMFKRIRGCEIVLVCHARLARAIRGLALLMRLPG